MKFKIFSIIFVFLFLSIVQTFAQSIPSQVPGLEEQVYINTTPKTPLPNQDVRVYLEAYGTDLNRANITWKVNGVIVKTGIGEKSIIVNTKKPGTVSVVTANIEINGSKLEKKVDLFAGEVDVYFEARTYTPPFYKGKAWFTSQSDIVVSAIPNIIENNTASLPTNTIFKWSRNGITDGNQSGYGKNTLSLKGSILLRSELFEVEAQSVRGRKAKGEISIVPRTPQIILYENNPLYGVNFNKAFIGEQEFIGEEKTLLAFPMFFSTNSKDGGRIVYEWTQNNQKIFLPENQSFLVLRNTGENSGKSRITVKGKSVLNMLQESSVSTTLDFNTDKKIFDF